MQKNKTKYKIINHSLKVPKREIKRKKRLN